jgi:hypothetical protein
LNSPSSIAVMNAAPAKRDERTTRPSLLCECRRSLRAGAPMQEIITLQSTDGTPLPADSRTCMNSHCKRGPEGTRGAVKSRKAKYCSAYCRVDVCRRNRPKLEHVEKPTRKRRRDTKYTSHSERQRAYHVRHRPYQLPEAIKDYLAMKKGMSEAVGRSVPELV